MFFYFKKYFNQLYLQNTNLGIIIPQSIHLKKIYNQTMIDHSNLEEAKEPLVSYCFQKLGNKRESNLRRGKRELPGGEMRVLIEGCCREEKLLGRLLVVVHASFLGRQEDNVPLGPPASQKLHWSQRRRSKTKVRISEEGKEKVFSLVRADPWGGHAR